MNRSKILNDMDELNDRFNIYQSNIRNKYSTASTVASPLPSSVGENLQAVRMRVNREQEEQKEQEEQDIYRNNSLSSRYMAITHDKTIDADEDEEELVAPELSNFSSTLLNRGTGTGTSFYSKNSNTITNPTSYTENINNNKSVLGEDTSGRPSRRFISSRLSSLTNAGKLGPPQRSVTSPRINNITHSHTTTTFASSSPPPPQLLNHTTTTVSNSNTKIDDYMDIEFGDMNPYQYAKLYNIPAEDFPLITKVYFAKQKEKALLDTPKSYKKYLQERRKEVVVAAQPVTTTTTATTTTTLSSPSPLPDQITDRSKKKRKHVAMDSQVAVAKVHTHEQQQQYHQQSPVPKSQEYIPLKPPSSNGALNGNNNQNRKIIKINGVEYESLELLGKGGSSKVYKIKKFSQYPSGSNSNAPNARTYALKKVIFDELDESSIDTFKGEIELLYKLQNKSRVVKLIDYEMLQGLLYLIMECGDYDLSLLLNNRLSMALDLDFVRFHFKEMCKCVKDVHDSDIIHSDLKPANFVFVKGILKIIDFGIADRVPDHTVNVYRDSQIGTPNYMAPEALERAQYDSNTASLHENDKIVWRVGRPSDIWSLGCILYQMVYGKPPYANYLGNDRLIAIMNHEIKIVYPEYGIGKIMVPKSCIELMKQCMKRIPKDRITINEILEKSSFLNPVVITENILQAIVKNTIQYGITQVDIDDAKKSSKDIDKLSASLWERINDLKL